MCGWKLEKAARSCGALRIAGAGRSGARADVRPGGGRGRHPGERMPAARPERLQRSCRKRSAIELDIEIRAKAVAWAIAAVDVETIDRINIRRASLLAMRLAVEQLATAAGLSADRRRRHDRLAVPAAAVIQGDGTSFSIAAASVLAKVYRDALLVELDLQVSRAMGWRSHKGYCSAEHMEALARLGPTPLHRKNWSPVAQRMLPFEDLADCLAKMYRLSRTAAVLRRCCTKASSGRANKSTASDNGKPQRAEHARS